MSMEEFLRAGVDPSAAIGDPPPPYSSLGRRSRAVRTGRERRFPAPSDSDRSPGFRWSPTSPHFSVPIRSSPRTEDVTEQTPLLSDSPPNFTPRSSGRQRSYSQSSTAPSLTQATLSLIQSDPDDDVNVDISVALQDERGILCTHDDGRQWRHQIPAVPIESRFATSATSHRSPLFSRRWWRCYFRPLTRRAYHAAAFHLLLLNFPYALIAWVYIFVFTVTGTTLLIALPLGALLCFLDLLGARTFARGELALQTTFHGPLAYPSPYPPRPIFRRVQPTRTTEVELGSPYHELSFYRNTCAMFMDWTSYQALFYFLVVKPSITLLLTVPLLVVVPVSYVLVIPAPMMLRVVRKLGIWQANVAVEGLYLTVS